MTGRALLLALTICGATVAQAPQPPGPAVQSEEPPGLADPRPADPETTNLDPGDIDPTAPEQAALDPAALEPAALDPAALENAEAAMRAEDEIPAFPPGLDPVIAVEPLNPRLDQQNPWYFTPEGRVIPQRRAPRPPTPVFRTPLTDAFSSRSANGPIELTFGGQTSLGGTLGMRVSRLETTPAVVELTVGESLALDDLNVRAYDADGELVERAPLRLEIEGPEGFVDMMEFDRDKRTLAAVGRGIGRIWVTSLLPTQQSEPFSIPVVLAIREPGSQGAHMTTRIHENVPASP